MPRHFLKPDIYENFDLTEKVGDYQPNEIKMNSTKHSIWRAVQAGVSFLLPLLVAHFPEWGNLTLGAVVFGVWHWVEKKVGSA